MLIPEQNKVPEAQPKSETSFTSVDFSERFTLATELAVTPWARALSNEDPNSYVLTAGSSVKSEDQQNELSDLDLLVVSKYGANPQNYLDMLVRLKQTFEAFREVTGFVPAFFTRTAAQQFFTQNTLIGAGESKLLPIHFLFYPSYIHLAKLEPGIYMRLLKVCRVVSRPDFPDCGLSEADGLEALISKDLGRNDLDSSEKPSNRKTLEKLRQLIESEQVSRNSALGLDGKIIQDLAFDLERVIAEGILNAPDFTTDNTRTTSESKSFLQRELAQFIKDALRRASANKIEDLLTSFDQDKKLKLHEHFGQLKDPLNRNAIPLAELLYLPYAILSLLRAEPPACNLNEKALLQELNKHLEPLSCSSTLPELMQQGRNIDFALEEVSSRLANASALEKRNVLRTLRKFGDDVKDLAPLVAKLYNNDKDLAVKSWALHTLSLIASQEAITKETISNALQSKEWRLNFTALEAIPALGDAAVGLIPSLKQYLLANSQRPGGFLKLLKAVSHIGKPALELVPDILDRVYSDYNLAKLTCCKTHLMGCLLSMGAEVVPNLVLGMKPFVRELSELQHQFPVAFWNYAKQVAKRNMSDIASITDGLGEYRLAILQDPEAIFYAEVQVLVSLHLGPKPKSIPFAKHFSRINKLLESVIKNFADSANEELIKAFRNPLMWDAYARRILINALLTNGTCVLAQFESECRKDGHEVLTREYCRLCYEFGARANGALPYLNELAMSENRIIAFEAIGAIRKIESEINHLANLDSNGEGRLSKTQISINQEELRRINAGDADDILLMRIQGQDARQQQHAAELLFTHGKSKDKIILGLRTCLQSSSQTLRAQAAIYLHTLSADDPNLLNIFWEVFAYKPEKTWDALLQVAPNLDNIFEFLFAKWEEVPRTYARSSILSTFARLNEVASKAVPFVLRIYSEDMEYKALAARTLAHIAPHLGIGEKIKPFFNKW